MKPKRWVLAIGESVYTRICSVDDNVLIARGWNELQGMCRLLDQIMPEAGMSSDWGDSENCSWITSESRAPESFAVGSANVQKLEEIGIW